MTIWQLYLLTRLESVACFFEIGMGGFFAASIILGVVMFVRYLEDLEDTDKFKQGRRYLKFMVIGFSICAFMRIFIPTNKDIAIILAGGLVTNSEEAKKLPANVLKTMNDFLEKYQEKENEANRTR